MATIFKQGSKCVCGRGKFQNLPETKIDIFTMETVDPPVPEGAYIQCDNKRCNKQAVVPAIYQAWKKEFLKQKKEKEK